MKLLLHRDLTMWLQVFFKTSKMSIYAIAGNIIHWFAKKTYGEAMCVSHIYIRILVCLQDFATKSWDFALKISSPSMRFVLVSLFSRLSFRLSLLATSLGAGNSIVPIPIPKVQSLLQLWPSYLDFWKYMEPSRRILLSWSFPLSIDALD